MKSGRAILTALAVIAVALVAWKLMRESAPLPERSTASAPLPKQSKIENQKSKITEAEEPSHLADALNSPSGTIQADLRIVSEVVDAFRTNFPREGNPVGNNAEITAALTGNNRLRLALIPPKHPAINQDGELCDRWGTPFFFHAESAHKMEIRSAGPDRKMWSADDVVFTP